MGHRAAIDSTEQEGVRVIAVRGDVDITRAGELPTQLRDAVWGFEGNVLIEVDDAHFIDASTLSRLARASLRVRRHGRRLGLVGASESVRRVMAIARLTDVLPAYDTMAEAMADFGAAGDRPALMPSSGRDDGSGPAGALQPRGGGEGLER